MRLLRVLLTLVTFVLAQPVMAQDNPPPSGGPIDDLQEQLDELAARVLTLESLLAGISRVGDDIFIDGANLHVRNGGGITNGANGFGNIIIGYNELRSDATDDRSGSHMLVLGSGNNFTSFGGIVSGELNSTEAPFSSIIGGDGNSTFSEIDFTGGLTKNMAIIGGSRNIAVGTGGVAVGGFLNDVTSGGPGAVLSGGRLNSVQFGNTFIGGGQSNTALRNSSAILGGRNNTTGGSYSSISGGRDNTANGFASSISGGRNNTTDGNDSSISGGNAVSAPASFDHPDTHTP